MNAERLVLFGWTRAILMQFAHPKVAAAIADHSSFRSGSLAALVRLHDTLRAMLAITFGDAGDRDAALARILTIHRRVNGTLAEGAGVFPAGTRYSAEDPALVLWVHATLLESLPLVHACLVGAITEAEWDAYCCEAAPVAIALGADPAAVPRTRRQLRTYFDTMRRSGEIVVSAQARCLSAALLAPPLSGLVAPVRWCNALIAVGLLPTWIREQYQFDWGATHDRRLLATVQSIRAARRITPRIVAWWPDALMARRT